PRSTLGGIGGGLGEASLYAPVAGNDRFFVFAGGTVTIADRTNMRHAFGVDAEQSANTGEPMYIPNGGFKWAGVGVNATYIFGKHWFLDGVAAATRFMGPASGSPVVVDK